VATLGQTVVISLKSKHITDTLDAFNPIHPRVAGPFILKVLISQKPHKLQTMSWILLTIALFLICSPSVKSQSKACCSAHSTHTFAMLADQSSFRDAHLSPLPFVFAALKGMMVEFDTPDGAKGSAFMVPSDTKSDKYLFVFHEWWGLNDHIKQEAERLAVDLPGVNVMAIDLYDGKLATDAETAGSIMQSIKAERAQAIIKGAIAYIRTGAQIQTIGWCFGGGWSMQASLIAGDKAKGCVIYYGMPETDEKKLQRVSFPVLGIFATQDGWINKEVVDQFEGQMKKLKKPVTIHWYDAQHAFANPSNPKFDEKAATEARGHALNFIKKNF
jgi:carboxymethylenebutenolidase